MAESIASCDADLFSEAKVARPYALFRELFGCGTHNCAGQGLARLEAQALVEALVKQVDSIELAEPATLRFNPIVRGYERLPLRVTARCG